MTYEELVARVLERLRSLGIESATSADAADMVNPDTMQVSVDLSRFPPDEILFGDSRYEDEVQAIVDQAASGEGEVAQVATESAGEVAVQEQVSQEAQNLIEAGQPEAAAAVLATLGGPLSQAPPWVGDLLASYGQDDLLQSEAGRQALAEKFNQAFPGGDATAENVAQRLGTVNAAAARQVVLSSIPDTAGNSFVVDLGPGKQPRVVKASEQAALEAMVPGSELYLADLIRASEATGVHEALLAFVADSQNLLAPTPGGTVEAALGFDGVRPGRFAGVSVSGRTSAFDGTDGGDLLGQAVGQIAETVGRAADRVESGRRYGLYEVGQELKRYKDQYGDWALAIIASQDRQLADKIVNDPYSISAQESEMIGQALNGYDPNALAQAGVEIGAFGRERFDFLRSLTPGGGDGGSQTVELPDQGALDESLRTLYRSWFQRDPSQSELSVFRASVNGEIRQTYMQQKKPNPFSPQAEQGGMQFVEGVSLASAPAEFVRQTAEYKRLFSNKPAGMSEEQYAAQFNNAQQSLLGVRAADPTAARAGMLTGDVNTSIGYTFGDQLGAGDNSTLLGRMARAASVIARRT